MTDPGQPGELVTQTAGAAPTCLTSVSAEYLESHEPGAVEWFTIVREGVPIPCGLMFPPGFDASQQYPLVLEIHGGPHGWFGEGFTALHQIIAGAGFLVLFVNPRGSSTFGSDFTHAVIGDWGGEDSLDLLAALDHVCAAPLRRPRAPGRAWLLLRRLHDLVADRAHRPLQGRGRGRTRDQSGVDVRHVRHRGLRGAAISGAAAPTRPASRIANGRRSPTRRT